MSKSSNAFPMFFRACVLESMCSREGYFHAGYRLAAAAETEVCSDVDDEVIEELHAAVASDDPGEAVWQWMRATLPRCMQLVPARRKATFVRGIEQAIEEGRCP